MKNATIYPGTFDPITNGHIDLICRASKIFQKIIVAVSEHTSKQTLFSFEERVNLAQKSLKSFTNVKVLGFQGLLVKFVREQKMDLILRGVRAIADFEFERQLSAMNKHLAPDIETLFLTPSEKYAHISSTFVRDIARLGGDVTPFVPKAVAVELQKHVVKDY